MRNSKILTSSNLEIYSLAFIVATLLLFSLTACADTDSNDSMGNNTKRGRTIDTIYCGIDRKICRIRSFDQLGHLHGAQIYYSPDGGNAVNYYSHGILDSLVNYYHDGKPMSRTIYQNGKKRKSIAYYKNGSVASITNFDGSVLNGECIFYYENGAIKVKENYREGKKFGEWNYYDENQKLVKSINYDD